MNKIFAIALIACAALSAGCATKNYGRQGELTSVERSSMTCRELELETAKVHGFLQRVEKESEFDARSVLSFLGDFGVGNVMEKSSAVESANTRLAQLQQVRTQRGCTATVAQPPAAAPADPTPSPTAAVPGPASAAPTVAAAPEVQRGQEAYQVESMARQNRCADARANLVAKGPASETYAVSCAGGESLMVRCEFGKCRFMQ
ncbi:hypothetical protein [Caldimonas sp. KR1-144]|uniref:hypothetical protein n=1 Tax=Caldimonas sp. KR1-144 TaxID=3400911 RepID=UPI003BFF9DBD